MPIETGERIAILETKVDVLTDRVRELAEKVDSIHEMVQQGRGAGRLIKIIMGFVGVALAGVLAAKWSALLSWLGK